MKKENRVYKIFMIFLCLVFVSFFVSLDVHGATKKKKKKYVKSKYALGALIDLSKGRAEMIKDLDKETKNYNKIKAAIEYDVLKEGETATRIEKEYGDPVITLSEEGTNLSRWVYKDSKATYSSKEKVYLFFNEEGLLVKWQDLSAISEDVPLAPGEI